MPMPPRPGGVAIATIVSSVNFVAAMLSVILFTANDRCRQRLSAVSGWDSAARPTRTAAIATATTLAPIIPASRTTSATA